MQRLQTRTEVPELERRQYNVGDRVRAPDMFEEAKIDTYTVANSTAVSTVIVRPGSTARVIIEQVFNTAPGSEPLKPWSRTNVVWASVSPDDRFTVYSQLLGRAA